MSNKGVGVEFEDCGSVKLEEMASVMVSDKRVYERGELINQIREAKADIEANEDRRRDLNARIRANDNDVRFIETERMPRAIERRKVFREQIVPPYGTGAEEPKQEAKTEPEPKQGNAPERTESEPANKGEKPAKAPKIEIRAKMPDESAFAGTRKELRKRMEEDFAKWCDCEIKYDTDEKVVGKMEVGNLPVRFRLNVENRFSRNASVGVVAELLDPADPKHVLRSARVDSGTGVLRLAQSEWENVVHNSVEDLQRRMEQSRQDIEALRKELAMVRVRDRSEVERMEADLAELEEALSKNKPKRRVELVRQRKEQEQEQEQEQKAEAASI
jgi:hypothetical protein